VVKVLVAFCKGCTHFCEPLYINRKTDRCGKGDWQLMTFPIAQWFECMTAKPLGFLKVLADLVAFDTS
jgi:hypothetical protein